MESTEELKSAAAQKKEREQALKQWLASLSGLREAAIQPMPGDASFRRYYRIVTPAGSFVAMDAPPPQENCRPFVAIAKALRNMGVMTPAIIAEDQTRGFLLLEDFGDDTYLKSLTLGNADKLYNAAMDTLSKLQACRHVPDHVIPSFSYDFMLQEWAWHKEWFLQKWLKLDLLVKESELDKCYARLAASAAAQPQVFMHRDFHSANLMMLPDNKVGVLDFQDAFIGPVTYDLVSLLRDCYIDWPRIHVRQWAKSYLKRLQQMNILTDIDLAVYLRWFDWMGVQRHLKALLTFARKHVRDHQSQYLHHVPRTMNYLISVTQQYPELDVLNDYLITHVWPVVQQEIVTCVR